MIAGAVAEAKKLNAPGGVIAVVDDGGNLIALEPLDNTFAAGSNISIGKARTAALFKKPTKVFEDAINKGRTTMVTVPNGIAFSPDEKHLYVGNWDEKNKVVMRYPVKGDGTLGNGEVFST